MSEQKERDFKVGDYVIWASGSSWSRRDVWGQIKSITPKGTVTAVMIDNHAKSEREFRRSRTRSQGHKYDCRLATPEEFAERMWLCACPKTELAFVSFFMQPDNTPSRVTVRDLEDAEKCRTAAKELVAIAKWLEEKP